LIFATGSVYSLLNSNSLMKQSLLQLLTILGFLSTAHSQILYGVKGGANLNFSKEVREPGSFQFALTEVSENASFGFSLGVFAEIEFDNSRFYGRPELLFSQVNYDFSDDFSTFNTTFRQNKIDVPLLIGYKLTGPLRIYAGPSLEFILNTNFDFFDLEELETDTFGINAHLGVALVFNRFEVDLRWERGLTSSSSSFYSPSNLVLLEFDTLSNMLILAVSYRFGIQSSDQ